LETLQLKQTHAIHAASHALLNLIPLFTTISESTTIRCECVHIAQSRPRPPFIILYDVLREGGSTRSIWNRLRELIRRSKDVVELCDCQIDDGCPGCKEVTFFCNMIIIEFSHSRSF